MKVLMARFLADESGATAVEYGLMGGAILGGMAMGMRSISDATASAFTYVASLFPHY